MTGFSYGRRLSVLLGFKKEGLHLAAPPFWTAILKKAELQIRFLLKNIHAHLWAADNGPLQTVSRAGTSRPAMQGFRAFYMQRLQFTRQGPVSKGPFTRRTVQAGSQKALALHVPDGTFVPLHSP